MALNPSNPLPRWRGFNVQEMFRRREEVQPDSITPGSSLDFRAEDIQSIGDWGFDFIRVPADYRLFWAGGQAWETESLCQVTLARIERLMRLAEPWGIHISLNFHRAPGYTVAKPREERNLWRDPEAETAFARLWGQLADYFKGVPSRRLSFDLVNEPGHINENFTRQDHERVIRGAVAAIRRSDPHRLIIADGVGFGNEPLPELIDLGIGQSCRGYWPITVSHYKASWIDYDFPTPPCWPGGDHFGRPMFREDLEEHYDRWAALFADQVGVHCGECGFFNQTPHDIGLAWFGDVLEVLKARNIGFALWQLRGSFGILESGRNDVAYVDHHGQRLDQRFLDLLRSH
ncbi:MAG: cellulase family glycosylhydrolase [Phycisphaeraceae bacterium]|nr:cellulase family glycosylhydrolase [Phycisphaeraceae bacterium]